MHFGRSRSDVLFYVLTLFGIGLLVFWRIRGDVKLDATGRATTDDTFSFPPAGYTDADEAAGEPPPADLVVTEPPQIRSPVDPEPAPPSRDRPLA
jgi:hypothetical protein